MRLGTPPLNQILPAVANDPRQFRGHLLIDTDQGPRSMGGAMDAWQRADFEALDDSWRKIAQRPTLGDKATTPTAPHRAYLERPRGHSKTADLAVMVSWVLLSSLRRLSGVAAAADQEQSRLLRDAVARLVLLNPWLNQCLEVQRNTIVNKLTGSKLDILSSDAATSYGLTPDFIVVDELTHWPKPDLWHSLVSAMPKRAHCLLVIIANAGLGMGESWQWRVRESARVDEACYFHSLDGPQASWLNAARLAEQKQILPKSAYARLWLNQWQRGAGDALDPEDVAAAFKSHLMEMSGQENEYSFVAGLDLGVKNDHAALVVLACDGATQRLRLALCRSWAPSPITGEVDLMGVERACLDAAQRYQLQSLHFDPHQASLMAQRLRNAGVFAVEMPFVGKNLTGMASAVLEAFASRRIDLYPDENLERDLLRLMIVEKSYGFKLEAIKDEYGHADRAIALAICLPAAIEMAGRDTHGIVEIDGILGAGCNSYPSHLWPRME